MAKSILETYEEMQSVLGVDTISFDAGVAKQTPYSIDDSKNADDQVLTAEKFGVGRSGQINTTLYSSIVDRGN